MALFRTAGYLNSFFLALAEKDYVFEDLLDYIRRDFPRWLSCQEPCELTDEEKEILCALAFEVIAIFDKNPNIAVLVCMMFCCWHEPEDDVHSSFNLDSALSVLHEFCFLNPSHQALNLLHEAAFSFALYYSRVSIHARVKRATWRVVHLLAISLRFNPRPREAGDRPLPRKHA